jgi:hypothetical protein
MLPTKFRFIWPSGFRGEDFFKSANQKQDCLWWPCLLMDQNEMSNFLPNFRSIGFVVSEEKIKI